MFSVTLRQALLAAALASPNASAQCFDWSDAFAPAGTGSTVMSQVVFDDGSGPALFVGGDFKAAGPVAASCVAKWNGASWAALGSGVNAASGARVSALAVFDDGSGAALYAAGLFDTAGGQPAANIAKWDG